MNIVFLVDDCDYFVKIHNYIPNGSFIFSRNYENLQIINKTLLPKSCINIFPFINFTDLVSQLKFNKHAYDIMNNKHFLLIPQYFVPKKHCSGLSDYKKLFNELYIDLQNGIINCCVEKFPHGTIEHTTNRNQWFHVYNSLGLPINADIYDRQVMSICPQILNIELCEKITTTTDINLFLIEYSLLADSFGLGSKLNYVASNKLWNNELSHNVFSDNIPIQYKISNVRTGCNNDSVFIRLENNDSVFEPFYVATTKATVSEMRGLMDEFKMYSTNLPLIRLGGNGDGSYVLCDIPSKIVYGYGVGNTYKFEEDFINRYNSDSCILYDHTVDTYNLPPKIRHNKIGCDFYNHDNLSTIETQITNNGHINQTDMLLKIDIEGYEWLSLLFTPDYILQKFNQIVIEWHWLDSHRNATIDEKTALLRKINKYFYLVHIHAVNTRPAIDFNGFRVNPVVEATYIRKDLSISGYIKNPVLPIPLDKPNDHCLHETSLSDFYPFNLY